MTPTRVKIARSIAVIADLVQIGLPIVFGEGFLSVFDDVLDVAVCGALVILVGWHYAFLPSFILEVVPLADLVPTWTIAVLIATRQTRPIDATIVSTEAPPPPQLNFPAEKS